jgi:hypothetical protein
VSKRKLIVPLVALVGIAGGGYAVKHSADVAHATEAKNARLQHGDHDKLSAYKTRLHDWNFEHEMYTATKVKMGPVYAAADKVDSMLLVGGYSYDELTKAIQACVRELKAAQRSTAPGYQVGALNFSIAIDEWSKAAEIWREWMNDPSDTRELDDLPMGPSMRKARRKLENADAEMQDLAPKGTKPTPPARPILVS